MKMKTNFTTSKSKSHRPTELLLHYSSHHCRHCCRSWSSKALLPPLQILDAKGNDVDLSIYKGKVLLIVNVASQCGLTNSNYKELSQLYEKYKDQDISGVRVCFLWISCL
ncbi:hypothetical protein ACSBR1_030816 [Camellia fascicularis]